MKKLLSCVMSFVLLLSVSAVVAIPALAAEPATLSVSSARAEKPGDTVTVDVSLQGTVAGIQIEIRHDPEVLTLVEIKEGPQCPNGLVEKSVENSRFVYASATESSVDGVIAQYTYEVNPNAAVDTESELEVVQALMVPEDINASYNATVTSHGSVVVGSDDGSEPSEPEGPGTGEPEGPGTGEPSDPGTGEPSNPGEPGNTNKPGSSSDDPKKSPTTGDTNAELLWIAMLLGGSAIVSAAAMKKQRV